MGSTLNAWGSSKREKEHGGHGTEKVVVVITMKARLKSTLLEALCL